jgi:tetratricopeptide (TPR) repeat protein
MYHPKLKGFFPCLELKWETEMSDQEREAFRNLATLEDKIKLIHRVPFVSSLLDKLVKLNYGEKSKEKSVQNREAGNAQFYAGNFKQAQILYSVAAFKAPKPGPKSNDLALAYANRSTAFQQLHCPRLSLRDADLALAAGYPEEKAFKLYERKGECHTSLSDVDKALDSFRTAIKMITATRELSKDKKEKFIGAIEKKMEKVKGEMNRGNGSNNNVKPGNNGTTDEHENHDDDDDDEMAEEEDNDLSQLIKR